MHSVRRGYRTSADFNGIEGDTHSYQDNLSDVIATASEMIRNLVNTQDEENEADHAEEANGSTKGEESVLERNEDSQSTEEFRNAVVNIVQGLQEENVGVRTLSSFRSVSLGALNQSLDPVNYL